MRRIVESVLIIAGIFESGQVVQACSFCAGGMSTRISLREYFRQSKFVAQGQLKNPKFDPGSGNGTTEFHIERVLKTDPTLEKERMLTIPRYLPVIGNTPPDHVVFFSVADGKLDPLQAVAASPTVADYLVAASKVDEAESEKRLGFYFQHLESIDSIVATDAFLEFAKAPDAELIKARRSLDPVQLRRWIFAPNTTPDRLGVYAMMLGLSGEKKDAERFSDLLRKVPLDDRVRDNVGGFLAALTLLDPTSGWALTQAFLTDIKRPYEQRLSAVGVVRFFQATRTEDSKPHILACYRGLIPHGDLADLAIDDLRRWRWWDLTANVLAQFDRPTHKAPIVRKGIVRYALQCPTNEAKHFVADLRKRDPKLVANVEETLKLFDPIK